MKKLSKIYESVWGDIYKRGTGEQVRTEDKFNSNIKDMKPIDLGSDFPVYWADIDLKVDDEDRFDWEETQAMIPKIEKTGWRLPKAPGEIYQMFGKNIEKRNEYLHRTWMPKQQGVITSEETNQILTFPTNKECESYWCDDDWEYNPKTGRLNYDNERCFDVSGDCYYGQDFSLISFNNMNKTRRIKIRLVKDK